MQRTLKREAARRSARFTFVALEIRWRPRRRVTLGGHVGEAEHVEIRLDELLEVLVFRVGELARRLLLLHIVAFDDDVVGVVAAQRQIEPLLVRQRRIKIVRVAIVRLALVDRRSAVSIALVCRRCCRCVACARENIR